jgi:hypothetical protein
MGFACITPSAEMEEEEREIFPSSSFISNKGKLKKWEVLWMMLK